MVTLQFVPFDSAGYDKFPCPTNHKNHATWQSKRIPHNKPRKAYFHWMENNYVRTKRVDSD